MGGCVEVGADVKDRGDGAHEGAVVAALGEQFWETRAEDTSSWELGPAVACCSASAWGPQRREIEYLPGSDG